MGMGVIHSQQAGTHCGFEKFSPKFSPGLAVARCNLPARRGAPPREQGAPARAPSPRARRRRTGAASRETDHGLRTVTRFGSLRCERQGV